MYSNSPFCYCKIGGFRTTTFAQYTSTVLLVCNAAIIILRVSCNPLVRVCTMLNADSLSHILCRIGLRGQ